MRTSCIVRLKPFHLQTKMFETFLSCKLFSCKDSVHVQSFAYAIHFLILVSCRTCVSRVVVWRALKTCFSYQTGLLRPSLHFPNPCSWLRCKRPIPCRCQLQCVTGNRKTRDYHPRCQKRGASFFVVRCAVFDSCTFQTCLRDTWIYRILRIQYARWLHRCDTLDIRIWYYNTIYKKLNLENFCTVSVAEQR